MNFDKKIKDALGKSKKPSKKSSFFDKPLGLNKGKLSFFNRPLSSSIKPLSPLKPKVSTPKVKPNINTKGASPQLQKKWKSFSTPKREMLRKILPDSDGDRVPDKFDCRPFNPMRQDTYDGANDRYKGFEVEEISNEEATRLGYNDDPNTWDEMETTREEIKQDLKKSSLKCPYCGSSNVEVKNFGDPENYTYLSYKCKNCGYTGTSED